MTGYDPSGQAIEWVKTISIEFTDFATLMTKSKASMTLFMAKYINKNATSFARSCFVYIKKSAVLLMIVIINFLVGYVKIIVSFCYLNSRRRKWLSVESDGSVPRLLG